MGADLGVPLSDLRPLCVSVAGGESRKTFTQFPKREKRKNVMTFITQRGEGQGKTKKERKATKSKGRPLEEGASRALMRQHGEGGCGARG